VLDLSGTDITTKGLASLATLRELEELRLARTSLDHEAAAAIPSQESLRFLDLSDTGIDDRSIASFSDFLRLRGIQ